MDCFRVTREHFSPPVRGRQRQGAKGQTSIFIFSGAGRVVPVGLGRRSLYAIPGVALLAMIYVIALSIDRGYQRTIELANGVTLVETVHVYRGPCVVSQNRPTPTGAMADWGPEPSIEFRGQPELKPACR